MFRGFPNIKNIALVVITFVITTIVVSCTSRVSGDEVVDINATPRQTVNDMYAVQSKNGVLQMRMEAKLMQRFQNDSTNVSYELFPEGFDVYAYNQEGLLETHIHSLAAKHTTTKDDEKWEAFGELYRNYNTIKTRGFKKMRDELYCDELAHKDPNWHVVKWNDWDIRWELKTEGKRLWIHFWGDYFRIFVGNLNAQKVQELIGKALCA